MAQQAAFALNLRGAKTENQGAKSSAISIHHKVRCASMSFGSLVVGSMA